MQKIENRLTVYFDEPFWVGIYERVLDGELEVSKITFGAEPKDYEVLAFLMERHGELRFLRRHRDAGMGTKSQQALAAQREEQKAGRKERRRDLREERKRQQFLIKQEKKKQRHRGR